MRGRLAPEHTQGAAGVVSKQRNAEAPPPPTVPSGLTALHPNTGPRHKERRALPHHSHVFPAERSVLFVGCLSQCLFFSLLFLLLFFLRESPLEVLDDAFFFLLFGSIALNLLTEGT